MKHFALTLDLKDDPALITTYEQYHESIPEAIAQSIREAGIQEMEIYRFGNRLFLWMSVEDDFSFERKAALDAANPDVQAWEALMWQFQQPLKEALPGEKWLMMKPVFVQTN